MDANFKIITYTRLAIYWQERARFMADSARVSIDIGRPDDAKLDQLDAAIYSANARAYLDGSQGR